MNPFHRILEITILIILPLLILYTKSKWSTKEIIFNAIVLPLIWYITYAPIHELGHVIGCKIVGLEINDYQLFTRFWEGSFGFAFVDIKEGYGENIESFIVLIMPYLIDFFFLIFGFIVVYKNKFKVKNSFLFGLTFLFFVLRSNYDLLDNYIGYFFNHSDFVLAGKIVGNLNILIFIVLSLIIGFSLTLLIIKKYIFYPSAAINN